jgi:hypothetical protein
MAMALLEILVSSVVGGLLRLKGTLVGLTGALLAVEAGLGAISTSWAARWQVGIELITTLDS